MLYITIMSQKSQSHQQALQSSSENAPSMDNFNQHQQAEINNGAEA